MKIHEFGDADKPVMLLLPGTMCYWRGNFGGVIDNLSKDFHVAVVAYTGFDVTDTESYHSALDEVEKIEQYIAEHYHGTIHAAYGSSLGGSFVAQLAARHNIHMKYGIIGSSDLTTRLPKQIDNGETSIHVFYAQKMGKQYLERYHKYFKNPVIHTQDMRHEEFLGVHPDAWCVLVKEICLS